MIEVLIAEDSPTVQQLLANLLEADPEIEVVGQPVTGKQAVEQAGRLQPDLITMDVMMPEMNGLEATREIMRRWPTRILVLTAVSSKPQLEIAFATLMAGALDLVSKPPGLGTEPCMEWEQDFLRKVKTLARVKVQPVGPWAAAGLPGGGCQS